jgi:hypothetical protein
LTTRPSATHDGRQRSLTAGLTFSGQGRRAKMSNSTHITLMLLTGSAIMVSACKPAEKPAAPAVTTEATAPAEAAVNAALPPLFVGIAGVERVPEALLTPMAIDAGPHWARCGDTMVARVVGSDGKDEGFIVARGVSFTSVDAAVDVPSQQAGVTARQGINLRSASYVQYFGEGVSRTDISGRTITNAGWSEVKPLTAPLPHWRADQTNGSWVSIFRPNVTDSAEWAARYKAADCAVVPAGAPA